MRDLIFNIELTSKCNYKCLTCPHGTLHDAFKLQDMTKYTFDILIKRIKHAASQYRIKEIINSGYGETFLCKDLQYFFNQYKSLKGYIYNNKIWTFNKKFNFFNNFYSNFTFYFQAF